MENVQLVINPAGNSGLILLHGDKPSQIFESLAVELAVSKPMKRNLIVGLDSSLDWSVDVACGWLYVSRLKTSVQCIFVKSNKLRKV